jgi:preprotein translocase subunit SecF
MKWMNYRKIYLTLSGLVIIVGIFSLFRWGLNLGVDFKGGSAVEYRFDKQISENDATKKIEELGFKINSIQVTGEDTYLIKLPTITEEEKGKISDVLKEMYGENTEELRFETVGPTIGPELVKKTIYALIISASAILLWVAYQFKSLKFGASAVLAMLHDSLVVLGLYSLFGHFWGAEVDFLFVTALLTILSFSVHDTIVVYDRIREVQKKSQGDIKDLANHALTETMVRSFNNSMTIVFMLVALVLLGGSTIKWFAVALLIGTISGTYSSPFVAVPLLVTWDEIEKKLGKMNLKSRFKR